MTVSPQWKHAHDRFRADITRVAKKNRLRFRTMTDLVNTAERYPPLIPVLIDWLKHTEARTGLTDPHECHEFRDGLARSLMTPDAIGTEALPLLFDALYLKPQPSPDRLAAIGNALQYLAQPADYDRMRRIAADRTDLAWQVADYRHRAFSGYGFPRDILHTFPSLRKPADPLPEKK